MKCVTAIACILAAVACAAEAKTTHKHHAKAKPKAAAAAPKAEAAPKPKDAPPDPLLVRHRLVAAAPREVKARLGAPDVDHTEGKGAFWTYRLADCALYVFFQDTGKGLKLSGVSAGPRRRGQSTPDKEECLTAAETR